MAVLRGSWLIFIFCLVTGSFADCDQGRLVAGYGECVEGSGLQNVFDAYGITDVSKPSWFTNLDQEGLKNACSLLPDYTSCLESVSKSCDNPVATSLLNGIFVGLEKSFSYICFKTFKEYMAEYHDCLQDQAKQIDTGIMKCNNDSMSTLASAKEHDVICGAMDDAMECIAGKVEDTCGQEASQWFNGYLEEFNAPMRALSGCPLKTTVVDEGIAPTIAPENKKNNKTDSKQVVAVVLALLAVVVLVGGVVFLVLRRQMRIKRKLHLQNISRDKQPDDKRTLLLPAYNDFSTDSEECEYEASPKSSRTKSGR